MLGLFGIFGRDERLKQLEACLHRLDLHPRLLPDGVKIAAVRLLAEAHGDRLDAAAIERAGELIAGAVRGDRAFAAQNGTALASEVDARIAEAAARGDGLDAKLVLLLLYANLVDSDLRERHDLVAE